MFPSLWKVHRQQRRRQRAQQERHHLDQDEDFQLEEGSVSQRRQEWEDHQGWQHVRCHTVDLQCHTVCLRVHLPVCQADHPLDSLLDHRQDSLVQLVSDLPRQEDTACHHPGRNDCMQRVWSNIIDISEIKGRSSLCEESLGHAL